MREEGERKVKTVSKTRGTYKITAGGHTHYCLRVLRAQGNSLSELFVNENGTEVLLRNYISKNSPGWRREMKTHPLIRFDDINYHRRGEGMALTQPLNSL